MTDFDLQQQMIEQRRKQYAGMRDYQSPQGQMIGRHYVAPNALQYLAAGLRSIGGMRGEDLAAKELQDFQTQRTEGTNKALAEFLRQSQGTPAETLPEGQEGPTRPAQAPNMQGAYAALLNAPDSSLRQMGMQGIAQIPEQQARAADRQAELEFRKQSAEAQRQQRMQEIQLQHQQRMEYLQQNNADRAAMAAEQRAFQQQMAQVAAASRQASAQPYFQFMQTGQGIVAGNARTGQIQPVLVDGRPVIGAQADPTLQGALAGAKAGAQTEAKTQTEARLGAPQAIAQGEETIRLVDDLLKAPGMKQAVGASRLLGIQNIPGTAAKDFDVRLDQLKGQQFLQAFEALKGGGQITEVEGKKATDAIARMNAASSENEFVKASREFQDIIRAGVNRAKKAQGGATPAPAAPKRLRFDAQGNPIQ